MISARIYLEVTLPCGKVLRRGLDTSTAESLESFLKEAAEVLPPLVEAERLKHCDGACREP